MPSIPSIVCRTARIPFSALPATSSEIALLSAALRSTCSMTCTMRAIAPEVSATNRFKSSTLRSISLIEATSSSVVAAVSSTDIDRPSAWPATSSMVATIARIEDVVSSEEAERDDTLETTLRFERAIESAAAATCCSESCRPWAPSRTSAAAVPRPSIVWSICLDSSRILATAASIREENESIASPIAPISAAPPLRRARRPRSPSASRTAVLASRSAGSTTVRLARTWAASMPHSATRTPRTDPCQTKAR